jgi:hypothetical protein
MKLDSSDCEIGIVEGAGMILKAIEVVEKSIPLLLTEIPTSSPWTCSGKVQATPVDVMNNPAEIRETPNLHVVRPMSLKLLPKIVTVIDPCFLTSDGVTPKSCTGSSYTNRAGPLQRCPNRMFTA